MDVGKYALLIGASSFGAGGPTALAAPEGDVTALRDVLADPAISGFQPGDIKFAMNGGLVGTQELVDWLFKDRTRDDLLLLYYTGHGFKDPNSEELYLALRETNSENPWTGSLRASIVRERINLCASQRKLVILDCCHSGAFGVPGAVRRELRSEALTRATFVPSGYGTVTMASSAAEQASYEVKGESIYTRLMVEALRSGATDPEATEVTARTLHDYLAHRVKEETVERQGLMEPVYFSAEKTSLVIANNPNPRLPLDKKLVENLWSEEFELIEHAIFRLAEIIDGGDRSQAEDARKALENCLENHHTLPYRAGERIRKVLDEAETTAAADEGARTDQEHAALADIDRLHEENTALKERLDALTQEDKSVPAVDKVQGPDRIWRNASIVLALVLVGLVAALWSGGLERFVRPSQPVEALKDRDKKLEATVEELTQKSASLDKSMSPPGGLDPGQTFKDCSACPVMIVLRGGTFSMGSLDDERERGSDEDPVHNVTIKSFALAVTEVTFDQWQYCIATGGCADPVPDDRRWGRGNRPVIQISWDDAKAYIAWLNSRVEEGDPYRLPSEAEWEFAARAETTTPFSTGDRISTDQANYDGDYTYGAGLKGVDRKKTVPVDKLDAANAWSLRHMHGNVWEWVEDCWHDSYVGAPTDGTAWLAEQNGDCTRRVRRGGSWDEKPKDLRSANRSKGRLGIRLDDIGFRPARTLLTP